MGHRGVKFDGRQLALRIHRRRRLPIRDDAFMQRWGTDWPQASSRAFAGHRDRRSIAPYASCLAVRSTNRWIKIGAIGSEWASTWLG
jgi:hypothetical protein